MASGSRLATALTEGLLSLPDGPVQVVRPPVGFDVSPVSGRSLRIVQSFAPDHHAYAVAGHDVTTELSDAAVTIIALPRSKDLARDTIARAASRSDLVIVDGNKTDGADSLWRAARKLLGDLPSVTRAHGRIFWFARTDALRDWTAKAMDVDGMRTVPGVFSAERVDPGSAALAAALPDTLPARVADLGAGWGWLSREILRRDGVTSLDVVEAEALALDCARANLTDPRVRFHWADATRFDSATPCDAVIMNPPFHTSRQGDPSLGQAFIAAAARMLSPQGSLWMVANRHLPYEAALAASFRHVEERSGTGAFKIFHARKPNR